jgi:Protein of unknown function (DUF3631)
VRDQFQKWAATCELARDPEMPPSLRNRQADNWRPLLAIADSLGHGEASRAAAVELCANRQDEDIAVMLLKDIRAVFLARGSDRIASKELIPALLAQNELWQDRRLTQGKLARMLKPFFIKPRTIRPVQLLPGDRETARGYMRADFEEAWTSYCLEPDTATQAGKIMHLPRH